MKGTYTFYENGKEIYSSENIITTAGWRMILSVLAETGGTFGTSFAYGSGERTPTVDDRELQFEIGRIPVTFKSAVPNTNTIVFKSTLDPTEALVIKEAGLYSGSGPSSFGSRLLLNFEPGVEDWTQGYYDNTKSRLGENSFLLVNETAGSISTRTSTITDLSGYSNVDEFRIAFYTNDTNMSYIRLKLMSDGENYYQYELGGIPTVGYNVMEFKKGAGETVGSPDWSNIRYVDITYSSNAASSINLDGLRIEDMDTESAFYALVSRSVLDKPVRKIAGNSMDIEYKVEVK